jgi:DNA-binding NtrC family response regulator
MAISVQRKPAFPILFVDDEQQTLLSFELTMSSHGMRNIETISDSRTVLRRMKEQTFSLAVLDLNMPHVSGFELLPSIVEQHPEVPVIVITAVNDVDSAVRCMKLGAFDYVVKPVDDTRLVTAIKRGLELSEIRNENELLKESFLREGIRHPEAFNAIVTRTPNVHALFKYIEAIAPTNLPILVTGETGTGKELFARSIHALSGRSGSLVPVNVAGVDDEFFSDTLFGHRRGAFTGAESERKGLIEQAENGTLFLDEIGDLSMESQVKLLRLLQEGQYYPLGSDVARLSNARIIVATHRDIRTMMASGSFRQDLYYRLKSHQITIPPLRERSNDLPLLVGHFLEKAAAVLGKKKPTPPKELYTLLKIYSFPGNIRELEGMIFDAVGRHESGILSLDSLREKIADSDHPLTPAEAIGETNEGLFANAEKLPTLEESEDLLVAEALKRADGNQTIAADLLGISRRALNNRLARANAENNKREGKPRS